MDGFNRIKASATSKRLFTFYHQKVAVYFLPLTLQATLTDI